MDIQTYITNRAERFNRHDYQCGFITAPECIYGLAELAALAKHIGWDYMSNKLRKKSDKLREIYVHYGTTRFDYAEFCNTL